VVNTFVSGNLNLMNDRTLRRRYSGLRSDPCIDDSKERMRKVVDGFVETSLEVFDPAVFGLSIDAVKNPEQFQKLLTHDVIVGGAYPNHMLPVPESAEELKAVLLGTYKKDPALRAKYKDLKKASEVKVCVVTLQKVKPGCCPFIVLVGRPQTTNEVNNFNKMMVDFFEEYCTIRHRIGGLRLCMQCNDGVSSDSLSVYTQLFKFYSGKSGTPSSTDANHNIKACRGQVSQGTRSCILGNHPID